MLDLPALFTTERWQLLHGACGRDPPPRWRQTGAEPARSTVLADGLTWQRFPDPAGLGVLQWHACRTAAALSEVASPLQHCKRKVASTRSFLRGCRTELEEHSSTGQAVRTLLDGADLSAWYEETMLSTRQAAHSSCSGQSRCFFCRERFALDFEDDPTEPVDGGYLSAGLADISSCCVSSSEEARPGTVCGRSAALPKATGLSSNPASTVNRLTRKKRQSSRRRGRCHGKTWYDAHTQEPAEAGVPAPPLEVKSTPDLLLPSVAAASTANSLPAPGIESQAAPNPYESAARTFWFDFMEESVEPAGGSPLVAFDAVLGNTGKHRAEDVDRQEGLETGKALSPPPRRSASRRRHRAVPGGKTGGGIGADTWQDVPAAVADAAEKVFTHRVAAAPRFQQLIAAARRKTFRTAARLLLVWRHWVSLLPRRWPTGTSVVHQPLPPRLSLRRDVVSQMPPAASTHKRAQQGVPDNRPEGTGPMKHAEPHERPALAELQRAHKEMKSAAAATLSKTDAAAAVEPQGLEESEELHPGDLLFRKGRPVTVVKFCRDTVPPHVVVRTEDGSEIGTELSRLSKRNAGMAEAAAARPISPVLEERLRENDELSPGEVVFRKGRPVTVVKFCRDTTPPHVVVRTEDGCEIGTELTRLSRRHDLAKDLKDEVLRPGDVMFRKGRPVTVVKFCQDTEPPHVVVRTEEGSEVGTELSRLSRTPQVPDVQV
eukprot:gnl/TRDRNA2_/TRDRNA2_188108_c0_seq1.p1 gnl/TRDRNA2_/TRDRNA2_188108_c0~~gnl/TRDRNA2_/TRDRNA2_188108_c0_seq1.p1  ORF type:complete len:716 (-),score=102.86 gnl/TRDRNA2_/TRDRNA2_188108_c0_seq1:98-2245(-)